MDAKTKTLLDEYKRKKRAREAAANGSGNKEEKKEEDLEEGEESGEIVENGDDDKKDVEVLDEFTLREDRVAKAGLDAIMREYSTDLAKTPPNELMEEKKQEKLSLVPPPVIPKDVKEDGVSRKKFFVILRHEIFQWQLK